MSQSIPTGYIPPPGNPRGLAQKACPGGRDLTFESCPGAGNSCVWIKFLQVKKPRKTSRIFDLFRGLHVFFNRIFSGLWVNFLFLLSHIPYKKSEELPLACLFEVFTGLWLSTPTFCIESYDYVKHFFPCIDFISDKYRVSQEISKKWGTLRC